MHPRRLCCFDAGLSSKLGEPLGVESILFHVPVKIQRAIFPRWRTALAESNLGIIDHLGLLPTACFRCGCNHRSRHKILGLLPAKTPVLGSLRSVGQQDNAHELQASPPQMKGNRRVAKVPALKNSYRCALQPLLSATVNGRTVVKSRSHNCQQHKCSKRLSL